MIWTIILVVLLVASLLFNAYQWHRWHSYRSKPAGVHSHTGVMQAIRLQGKGGTDGRQSR